MRLIVQRDEPVEEIAAEDATLARFAAAMLLAPDRAPEAVRSVPHLQSLPLVIDDTIPPLTVLLRTRSTTPTGAAT